MKAGFRYRYAHGGNPGRRHIERISALRIPPAWKTVAIDQSPTAMIQAVGRDKAGRWQYLYHERAVARRERRKHRRLIEFSRRLPLLRAQVAKDLNRKDYGRERVLACMLRILSICFLRPGSEEYASENGSYGIATLKPRHVEVRGHLVRLRFNGKSGKDQRYEFNDRRIARAMRALLKAGGRRVFTFQDSSGEWKEVRRQHINVYIKEAMGDAFSAKDFRTWAGTITCACALARIGRDPADSAAVIKRKVVTAVKETAEALGNTPAVSRTSYISPGIIRAFAAGRLVQQPVGAVSALATTRGRLNRCEHSLIRLLEQFGAPSSRRGRPETLGRPRRHAGATQ